MAHLCQRVLPALWTFMACGLGSAPLAYAEPALLWAQAALELADPTTPPPTQERPSFATPLLQAQPDATQTPWVEANQWVGRFEQGHADWWHKEQRND